MSKSWLIVPLLVLYLMNLGSVGFLGPDEPRYASIGREMARSGDWITPRLDGQPWFEKSPLLYWMTAAGHLLHLSDEWAARLPMALISLAFLIFFYDALEKEFSDRVALAATGILSTSALWMAYSFASLTDLPMSAALSAAVLIALFDTRPGRGYSVGVLLGLAVLAKGLVPLVLFAPLFLIARGKRLQIAAATVVVAAPWYLLCYWKNGPVFWNEFIMKHHVERFFSASLDHVQPFWYYGPVMLGALFPWTPLAAMLVLPKMYRDVRVRTLMFYVVTGFVFFSASKNKLPGYILPLMPALAAVLGVALEGLGKTSDEEHPGRTQAWWLAACALLLVALPTIVRGLPIALLSGVSKVDISWGLALPFVAITALVWSISWMGKPHMAMLTAALATMVGAGYLKSAAFPLLDRQVSVRAFWNEHREEMSGACLADVRRSWEYGLDYYAGHAIPLCPPGSEPTTKIVVSHDELQIVKQ